MMTENSVLELDKPVCAGYAAQHSLKRKKEKKLNKVYPQSYMSGPSGSVRISEREEESFEVST